MDEEKANALAALLGGDVWVSGGGINLVLIRRADGRIVALTDEVVCEYADEEALEGGGAEASIRLV